jgi:hypothetical protein
MASILDSDARDAKLAMAKFQRRRYPRPDCREQEKRLKSYKNDNIPRVFMSITARARGHEDMGSLLRVFTRSAGERRWDAAI